MLQISVVIPVYEGERTLPQLVGEIQPLTVKAASPMGREFHVSEVILVWDRGPGTSHQVIADLASEHSWVRPIWLSRNFGQHAATIAGMSSSSGDWIVTMDEDGQHDPVWIGSMVDAAYEGSHQLIYAQPVNDPPHSIFRNTASSFAKWTFHTILGSSGLDTFHSYRLIEGEVARSAAAYTGAGVYLDVALSWVVASAGVAPIPMRMEGRTTSSYTTRKLFSHAGRLIVSSGTRPLTFVSGIGLVVFVVGMFYAVWVAIRTAVGTALPPGWSSTLIAVLLVGGLTLFSVGVIAHYMSVLIKAVLGRPLYVIVSSPTEPDSKYS